MEKYYFKKILFAWFFITGTTLFSCANKNDNKKENSKTEVVVNSVNKQNDNSNQISSSQTIQSEHAEKNTKEEEEVISSKITSYKNNSNHSISSPEKENLVKSAKLKENKNLQSEKTNNEKNSSAKVMIKTTYAGEIASQTNAEFPGGIEQFHNFFMKEYKKPEGVSYWKINLNLAFAVEKNGTVSFLECSPSVE